MWITSVTSPLGSQVSAPSLKPLSKKSTLQSRLRTTKRPCAKQGACPSLSAGASVARLDHWPYQPSGTSPDRRKFLHLQNTLPALRRQGQRDKQNWHRENSAEQNTAVHRTSPPSSSKSFFLLFFHPTAIKYFQAHSDARETAADISSSPFSRLALCGEPNKRG